MDHIKEKKLGHELGRRLYINVPPIRVGFGVLYGIKRFEMVNLYTVCIFSEELPP